MTTGVFDSKLLLPQTVFHFTPDRYVLFLITNKDESAVQYFRGLRTTELNADCGDPLPVFYAQVYEHSSARLACSLFD